MVEFALTFPMFMVLLLAIFDFTRMQFTYVSLINGAREMARTATFQGKDQAEVLATFNNLVWYLGAPDPGDTVTVTFVNAVCATKLLANPSGTLSGTCTDSTNDRYVRVTCTGFRLDTSTCATVTGFPSTPAPTWPATTADRRLYSNGYVDVSVRSNFILSPLFDAFRTRVNDAGGQLAFLLQTSTRAYFE